MRKTTICLSKNKAADQLCSNCTADQRLYFRFTDSKIRLLSKSKISKLLAIYCDCTNRFVSDLFGNNIFSFLMIRYNINMLTISLCIAETGVP